MGQLLKHVLLAAGIVLADEAIDKRGVNTRRGNAVAANVLSNVVARHRIGHREHCPLAHGVREAIGQSGGGGDRSEIQDDSSAARLHVIDDRVHAVINALYVDAEDALEIFFAGSFELADVRNSRIVHEDMDRIAGPNLAEHIFDLLLA